MFEVMNMKKVMEITKRSWRLLVTSAFVILVFTVPAAKGFLGKFMGVHASGSHQHGNNHGNHNDNSTSRSQSYSSNSAPNSAPNASPVNNNDSCSTGRRHSHSHHGHNRTKHRHYHSGSH